MENHNFNRLLMDIHLNDSDISQMPELLRSSFLDWLPQYLKTKRLQPEVIARQESSLLPVYTPLAQNCLQPGVPVCKESSKPETPATQLTLDLTLGSQTSEEKADNSHVRLSQLCDAGITKPGMPVRVKLKRDIAKKLGRDYINSLEISAKGTIVWNGQEFDKPSLLATKVNGGAANGWEYIEIKKNDQWICLDELREIWRKTND